MKDQTIEAVKKLAQELSIVVTNDEIKFTFGGHLTIRGEEHRNPRVMIDLELAEKMAEEIQDADKLSDRIKEELVLVD